MEGEKRLGIIGIFIENLDHADRVNDVIHAHSSIVVARMGIPYRERKVSVISLLVDGTTDEINTLTGGLGRIPEVSVKSMLRKEK